MLRGDQRSVEFKIKWIKSEAGLFFTPISLFTIWKSYLHVARCRWQIKNTRQCETRRAVLLYFKLINEISSHENKRMTVLANPENVCACTVGTCKAKTAEGRWHDLIFTWSHWCNFTRFSGGLLISYYQSIKREFRLLITPALRIAFKLFISLQGICKNVYSGV